MRGHPLFKAYLAFASVCFFWGTTYLAIRMSLEAIPPMVLVSGRFILSGTIMLIVARAVHATMPRGKELVATILNGILILGVGNSCLTIAQLWIPSGLAALIITTSPLWMVGIDAALPGGEKLRLPALAGILIGGAGAVLLVAPQAAVGAGGVRVWIAFLLLQVANFSWSFGSIRQRRMGGPTHPVVSGAVQQLAAGLAFLPSAFFHFGHPFVWQPSAYAAALYLVVFGSIVGYSSYIYALDKLPVALVSVYTYVNPVVALWLGWLFYREHFGWLEAAGMGVIFAGVAVVERYSRGLPTPELD